MKHTLAVALGSLLIQALAVDAFAQEASGSPPAPAGDSVTIIGAATDPAVIAVARTAEAACLQRDPALKPTRACGVYIYEFDASRGAELSASFKMQRLEITQRPIVGYEAAKDGDPAHARIGLVDVEKDVVSWVPVPVLVKGWDYPYHLYGSRISGNYHFRLVDFLTPENCKLKAAACARNELSDPASFDLARFKAKSARVTGKRDGTGG